MKAIIRHMLTVYEAMHKASSEETIDGNRIRIYQGQISKLYASCNIPQSYYTEIFDQLERQGSVTYLQRGSKSVNTIIALHYPPTEDALTPRRGPRDLTSAEEFANLIETVKKLDTLVGGIHIGGMLVDLDKRLLKLESAAGIAQDSNNIDKNNT